MYRESQLLITGYKDVPVPNRFYRQESETHSLAIILPGFGYNVDLPLLYYPGRIALSKTMDLLCLETEYNLHPTFSKLTDAEQLACLDADADAAFDAAVSQRAYQKIIFIGKSLGTMEMGHLLERYHTLPNSRWVWLTPVLTDPRLVEQIQKHHPISLFAMGTNDHYYDDSVLRALIKATQGKLITIQEANHSLEIPGNIRQSIQALNQVMTEIEAFMANRFT
jgi:hypothetical protein